MSVLLLVPLRCGDQSGVGFALLLQQPPRWHEEPPSEAQQNFLGSVPGVHGCAGCSGASLGGVGAVGVQGEICSTPLLLQRLGGTPWFGGTCGVRLGRHRAGTVAALE